MKAKSTKILPPTVSRMHIAKHIAMKIVCHNANGGKTLDNTSSVIVSLDIVWL